MAKGILYINSIPESQVSLDPYLIFPKTLSMLRYI